MCPALRAANLWRLWSSTLRAVEKTGRFGLARQPNATGSCSAAAARSGLLGRPQLPPCLSSARRGRSLRDPALLRPPPRPVRAAAGGPRLAPRTAALAAAAVLARGCLILLLLVLVGRPLAPSEVDRILLLLAPSLLALPVPSLLLLPPAALACAATTQPARFRSEGRPHAPPLPVAGNELCLANKAFQSLVPALRTLVQRGARKRVVVLPRERREERREAHAARCLRHAARVEAAVGWGRRAEL